MILRFLSRVHNFFFTFQGRGIFATRDYNKGDFVVEYAGDLVSILYNLTCH